MKKTRMARAVIVVLLIAAWLVVLGGCSAPPFPSWGPGIIYGRGDLVVVGRTIYGSLRDNNVDHYPPDTVGEWWGR